MTALTDERHEQFARAVAEGRGMAGAYREAFGVRDMTVNRLADGLARRREVAKRIGELQEELAEEAVWALADQLEYLRDVAMTPYEAVDASSPLCLSIRQTRRGSEYRTPDKLDALALYCRLVGDFRSEAAAEEQGPTPLGEIISAIRAGDLEKAGAIELELREMGAWKPLGHSEVDGAEARPVAAPRSPDVEHITPKGHIWVNGRYLGQRFSGGGNEIVRASEARQPAAEPAGKPAPSSRKPGEPLDNARHERFAQYVARGETYTGALMKVYRLAREVALGCMTRISHRPEVQERIAELRARAAHSVNWTIPQRRLYLKRLVLTPLEQVTTGSRYCQSIWRYPKGLAVRMPNKLRAIELYNRLTARGQNPLA
ncbi:hypothetical protein BH09VER1_BH09VER1_03150 [soil metagenome]